MSAERSVVFYIAASIDGFIARADGDLEWLTMVESGDEDYGYGNLIDRVDTVIFGRRTFMQVTALGEDPNADKVRYVMSRRPMEHDSVITWSESPKQLIEELRESEGDDIWLVGGGEVADSFLRADLIDELIISIIPVMLGSGVPLFRRGRPEASYHLDKIESFPSGLAQLTYTADRQ